MDSNSGTEGEDKDISSPVNEDNKNLQPTLELETQKYLKEIHTWWEIPAIAHFCSLFKAVFGFCDFDIEDLEDALLSSPADGGSTLVIDIICQLLNGCYARDDIKYYNYDLFLKDIFKQRWQFELGRTNPMTDATFLELPVRQRVEVLHALCDFRLDADDVAEMLKGLSGDSLRVEPLGVDGKGSKYWYFYGTRLYKETKDPEPEEEKSKGRRGTRRRREEDTQELLDKEDEGDKENEDVEQVKRNPVLSAKPRMAEKMPGDQEDEEIEGGMQKEEMDDNIIDTAEEEEDDEQKELAEALYESENGEEDDDDGDDVDFEEELKKKKSSKSKKKSATKKASARQSSKEKVEAVQETKFIESVFKPRKKRVYYRGGRSRSRSRSQGQRSKSKNQSAISDPVEKTGKQSQPEVLAAQAQTPVVSAAQAQTPEVSTAQAQTPEVSTEQKKTLESSKKQKQTVESKPTPVRRSRRQMKEDAETEIIFDLNIPQTELKRLTVDGFYNQLNPLFSRNTRRGKSSVGNGAVTRSETGVLSEVDRAQRKNIEDTVSSLSARSRKKINKKDSETKKTSADDHPNDYQQASGNHGMQESKTQNLQVSETPSLLQVPESNQVLDSVDLLTQAHETLPGPVQKKGSSRRKSTPQRRQNKDPVVYNDEAISQSPRLQNNLDTTTDTVSVQSVTSSIQHTESQRSEDGLHQKSQTPAADCVIATLSLSGHDVAAIKENSDEKVNVESEQGCGIEDASTCPTLAGSTNEEGEEDERIIDLELADVKEVESEVAINLTEGEWRAPPGLSDIVSCDGFMTSQTVIDMGATCEDFQDSRQHRSTKEGSLVANINSSTASAVEVESGAVNEQECLLVTTAESFITTTSVPISWDTHCGHSVEKTASAIASDSSMDMDVSLNYVLDKGSSGNNNSITHSTGGKASPDDLSTNPSLTVLNPCIPGDTLHMEDLKNEKLNSTVMASSEQTFQTSLTNTETESAITSTQPSTADVDMDTEVGAVEELVEQNAVSQEQMEVDFVGDEIDGVVRKAEEQTSDEKVEEDITHCIEEKMQTGSPTTEEAHVGEISNQRSHVQLSETQQETPMEVEACVPTTTQVAEVEGQYTEGVGKGICSVFTSHTTVVDDEMEKPSEIEENTSQARSSKSLEKTAKSDQKISETSSDLSENVCVGADMISLPVGQSTLQNAGSHILTDNSLTQSSDVRRIDDYEQSCEGTIEEKGSSEKSNVEVFRSEQSNEGTNDRSSESINKEVCVGVGSSEDIKEACVSMGSSEGIQIDEGTGVEVCSSEHSDEGDTINVCCSEMSSGVAVVEVCNTDKAQVSKNYEISEQEEENEPPASKVSQAVSTLQATCTSSVLVTSVSQEFTLPVIVTKSDQSNLEMFPITIHDSAVKSASSDYSEKSANVMSEVPVISLLSSQSVEVSSVQTIADHSQGESVVHEPETVSSVDDQISHVTTQSSNSTLLDPERAFTLVSTSSATLLGQPNITVPGAVEPVQSELKEQGESNIDHLESSVIVNEVLIDRAENNSDQVLLVSSLEQGVIKMEETFNVVENDVTMAAGSGLVQEECSEQSADISVVVTQAEEGTGDVPAETSCGGPMPVETNSSGTSVETSGDMSAETGSGDKIVETISGGAPVESSRFDKVVETSGGGIPAETSSGDASVEKSNADIPAEISGVMPAETRGDDKVVESSSSETNSGNMLVETIDDAPIKTSSGDMPLKINFEDIPVERGSGETESNTAANNSETQSEAGGGQTPVEVNGGTETSSVDDASAETSSNDAPLETNGDALAETCDALVETSDDALVETSGDGLVETGGDVLIETSGDALVKTSGGDALVETSDDALVETGDVLVETSGDALVETGGDVLVETCSGDALVETSGGDALVKTSGSDAIIETSGDALVETSGDDALVETSGGDALIEITGGDTVIETSAGNALVETSGGDVLVETSGGDALVETIGGDALVEKSGDDVLVEICGNTLVETVGGALVETNDGDAIIETSGGDAIIETSDGDAIIETSNSDALVETGGYVPAETSRGARQVETISGDVIPAEISSDIHSETESLVDVITHSSIDMDSAIDLVKKRKTDTPSKPEAEGTQNNNSSDECKYEDNNAQGGTAKLKQTTTQTQSDQPSTHSASSGVYLVDSFEQFDAAEGKDVEEQVNENMETLEDVGVCIKEDEKMDVEEESSTHPDDNNIFSSSVAAEESTSSWSTSQEMSDVGVEDADAATGKAHSVIEKVDSSPEISDIDVVKFETVLENNTDVEAEVIHTSFVNSNVNVEITDPVAEVDGSADRVEVEADGHLEIYGVRRENECDHHHHATAVEDAVSLSAESGDGPETADVDAANGGKSTALDQKESGCLNEHENSSEVIPAASDDSVHESAVTDINMYAAKFVEIKQSEEAEKLPTSTNIHQNKAEKYAQDFLHTEKSDKLENIVHVKTLTNEIGNHVIQCDDAELLGADGCGMNEVSVTGTAVKNQAQLNYMDALEMSKKIAENGVTFDQTVDASKHQEAISVSISENQRDFLAKSVDRHLETVSEEVHGAITGKIEQHSVCNVSIIEGEITNNIQEGETTDHGLQAEAIAVNGALSDADSVRNVVTVDDVKEDELLGTEGRIKDKVVDVEAKPDIAEVKEELIDEVKLETDIVLEKSSTNVILEDNKVEEDYLLKSVSLFGDNKPLQGELSHWQLVCDTVEDWGKLASEFKDTSVHKEKLLYRIIKNDFLPEIPAIMADKLRAREKRAREMLPRRSSYRLELKKMEEEEKERLNREVEEEEERQKAIADEERKQQMKIEEEKRHREEREKAREERANRARLREERARLIAEGREIPPELMNGLKQEEIDQDDFDEEMQFNLEKVLLTVKRNEYSWPFLEAVEEVNTPDFFDTIKEPMDLMQIEKRLAERGYKTKEQFERDMNLVFDNCIEYHGKDSDFGYMAENLKGVFERSMRRTFRVYLEPAPHRGRRRDSWGESTYDCDYALAGSRSHLGQRSSRKRGSYKENSDSDSELEPYMTGRVVYPSGRKWGSENDGNNQDDQNKKSTQEEGSEDQKKVDEDTEAQLKPRATWSYRRELVGHDAADFESYIPKSSNACKVEDTEPPKVVHQQVDFSKFAGAKFRYSLPIKDGIRKLPQMIINQYVKKAKPANAQVGQTSAPTTAPGKPPVRVVKISREEYEKLLAEKKITIVNANSPAGQVVRLQSGLQLKETVSSPKASVQPMSSSMSLAPVATAPTSSAPKVDQIATARAEESVKTLDVSPDWSKLLGTSSLKSRSLKMEGAGNKDVDIKARLRQVNEKLASKLKTPIKENAVYENSKIVRGQVVFNVAPDKMESSTLYGDYKSPLKRRSIFKPSKYLHPSAIPLVEKLSLLGHEDKPRVPHVKRVRFSDEFEVWQRDLEHHGSDFTSFHKAHVGHDAFHKADIDSDDTSHLDKQNTETNDRLQDQSPDSHSTATSSKLAHSSSSSLLAFTSSLPSTSKSATSESSIYEKWKRRASKTNNALLTKHSHEEEEISFIKQKTESASTELTDVSLDTDEAHVMEPNAGTPEDEQFLATEKDHVCGASESSKKRQVTMSQAENEPPSKKQKVSEQTDTVAVSEQDTLAVSEQDIVAAQPKPTSQESDPSSTHYDAEEEAPSLLQATFSLSSQQVLLTQEQDDISVNRQNSLSKQDLSLKRQTFSSTEEDEPSSKRLKVSDQEFSKVLEKLKHVKPCKQSKAIAGNSMENLPDICSDESRSLQEKMSSEIDENLPKENGKCGQISPQRIDDMERDSFCKALELQHRESTLNTSPPDFPILSQSRDLDMEHLSFSAAAGSSSSLQHSATISSLSSPSTSSSSSRMFRLPDLSSQLAQAIAQKKWTCEEKSYDSPRALSPPLLEPIQPVGGGDISQESEATSPNDDDDDEMPVLVPDHLPLSLVEPGSDNIFQRMMSPEKSKI